VIDEAYIAEKSAERIDALHRDWLTAAALEAGRASEEPGRDVPQFAPQFCPGHSPLLLKEEKRAPQGPA
jgi:hypothetical protein